MKNWRNVFNTDLDHSKTETWGSFIDSICSNKDNLEPSVYTGPVNIISMSRGHISIAMCYNLFVLTITSNPDENTTTLTFALADGRDENDVDIVLYMELFIGYITLFLDFVNIQSILNKKNKQKTFMVDIFKTFSERFVNGRNISTNKPKLRLIRS